ncbi:hypothetical protein GDO78_004201 [Eleutherodactylus coqui]|uniref:Uncharacterized protein n=1 Tax=Eleutherodactylus coqui TaxID=57060 RepID=A0A8J6ERN3_ELECQ|nr:hypothetical protein GDO78_004201 [Eleutherodactylus coqui]
MQEKSTALNIKEETKPRLSMSRCKASWSICQSSKIFTVRLIIAQYFLKETFCLGELFQMKVLSYLVVLAANDRSTVIRQFAFISLRGNILLVCRIW